ncbi:MAG TPA: amidohydrolase [Gemmataceae bacterium]|nr:amidohydrolase [Gemmataceae bacterium]
MKLRHACLAAAFLAFLGFAPVAGTQGPGKEEPADLVLRNGTIVTVDDGNPVVKALAARNGKIVAVGSDADIGKYIGDKTKVIDLKGQMAMPGFIESHGHFTGLGKSKMMLDLTTAKTWDDIVAQVAEAVKKAPEGTWILGRGWHQDKWTQKPEPNIDGYPIHTKLSEVSPKHPVLLTHASGHATFANAEAMRLANVDAKTKSPSGGEVVKDAKGNPIGLFRETAGGLISRAQGNAEKGQTAKQRQADLLKSIDLATDECLANGVTSFQDAGSGFDVIETFKQLASANKLKVRLWVMIRAGNNVLEKLLPTSLIVGLGDFFLTVRAIKVTLDGALGPHGAWLLDPYEDLPTSRGLNTVPVASLKTTAELAAKNKFQLCVHAIGDKANRETLNIFEDAFKQFPTKESRRWRIEHAQHLHPDDIGRFAKLGVIASMQGIHCTSDAVYVIKRLGNRRAEQGAYMWQSLLKSGAILCNGSDVPVENISPLKSFYASVTRKLPSGVTFFPEQKMTRQQALKSYTLHAAYAAFEEEIKGSLSLGKLADIVVLSRDIMTVPDEQILGTDVMYTIVGGKVVYEKK